MSAAAAIAWLERGRQLQSAWQLTASAAVPSLRREISGFSPHAGLALDIQVTGVKRMEWLEDSVARPAGTQAACDGLVLSANVSVATDDGALLGTLVGATVQVYSEQEASLRASGDISNFTGALQLNPRPGEGLRARLAVSLLGDRARGRLAVEVQLPPTGVPPVSGVYRPLDLHWPIDDGCNDSSFPYAGEEGVQRAAPILATLAASSPSTAAYLAFVPYQDAASLGETQLTLDVSDPTEVCQGRAEGYHPRAPGQYWQLQLAGQLRTGDGRYDLSLPLSAVARSFPDGTISELDVSYYSPALPVQQFQERFRIAGLDFGDAECADLRLEYAPLQDGPLARLLLVQAGPCSSTGARGELINARAVEMLGR